MQSPNEVPLTVEYLRVKAIVPRSLLFYCRGFQWPGLSMAIAEGLEVSQRNPWFGIID